MSEAPPQSTPEATPNAKPEAAQPEPSKEAAAVAPAEPAAVPATPPAALPGALEDAAKAMDPVAPKDTAAGPSPSATPPVAPPAAPSPAANTSGMHLQYVAPGVRRQSMLQDFRYHAVFVGAMLLLGGVLLFRGGGGLAGDLASGSTNNTDTTTAPQSNANAVAQTPPDPTYVPLENRAPIPTADFTVNAGAIGGTAVPPLHSRFDAGVNKGGYADERAAIDAAEAMIAKDPDKALAMVDQHDKDYPRGIMDPDARIVRIEAFQKKGDEAKALALGNEFLEDYPHSPRAGRVQAIVEALKNKNGGGNTPP